MYINTLTILSHFQQTGIVDKFKLIESPFHFHVNPYKRTELEATEGLFSSKVYTFYMKIFIVTQFGLLLTLLMECSLLKLKEILICTAKSINTATIKQNKKSFNCLFSTAIVFVGTTSFITIITLNSLGERVERFG